MTTTMGTLTYVRLVICQSSLNSHPLFDHLIQLLHRDGQMVGASNVVKSVKDLERVSDVFNRKLIVYFGKGVV